MKVILFLLIFPSIVYCQVKGKAVMLIYPGCEIYKNYSNEKLKDCFANNVKKELLFEVENVLLENKLSLKQVQINAKVQFQVSELGEFINLEVIGNDAEKILFKKAFAKYANRLEAENKKIIPAINNEGKSVTLGFNLPFKIINP